MKRPTNVPPEQIDEAIIAALGQAAAHSSAEHEAYADWWFSEARAADRSERGVTIDAARRRGAAFQASALARRMKIERRIGEPAFVMREPGAVGTLIFQLAPNVRRAPHIDLGVAAGSGRELWDEVIDRWLDVEAEFPDGRYLAVRIVGESMSPVMHTGDTVLVRVGGEIALNTVVVARHPEDGYVCKRVHAIGDGAIELASTEPGRPIIRIPHDRALIVGTVLVVWCKHDAA